jgi:catechol 2,3-dioxygenase-like lactoylglutathione lyase family enzyme
MTSVLSGMAFVRLSAPDLGRMEAFLLDFGLITAHRDERRLYMRGTGEAPFIHVTELGPPGIVSCAYTVEDEEVLHRLASRGGTPGIEALDGPGGGRRLRLRDPNGCHLELVCGREAVEPLPARPAVRPPTGSSRLTGPAHVVRISHTAMMTTDARSTLDWYHDTLGLIPTDELRVGEPGALLGQFNRVDRGDTPVDHHVIFIFNGPKVGLHHVSFVVEGADDLFMGADHLAKAGHDHVRGVGRHALGCQLFDYWMSPFGQMHEHWSSAEKMNAASAMNVVKIGEGMTHDTGDRPPARFVTQATPYAPWPDPASILALS